MLEALTRGGVVDGGGEWSGGIGVEVGGIGLEVERQKARAREWGEWGEWGGVRLRVGVWRVKKHEWCVCGSRARRGVQQAGALGSWVWLLVFIPQRVHLRPRRCVLLCLARKRPSRLRSCVSTRWGCSVVLALDRENRSLISADRKTSLLSRLQYSVSLKSSTIDLLADDVKLRSRVMLGRSLSLLM